MEKRSLDVCSKVNRAAIKDPRRPFIPSHLTLSQLTLLISIHPNWVAWQWVCVKQPSLPWLWPIRMK